MTDRSKLIHRIKAMKAKAESTTSEAEAEAFAAKAADMVLKHQVESHELADEIKTVTYEEFQLSFGNATKGVLALYCSVSEVFNCSAIGWAGRQLMLITDIALFGAEEDRAMVRALIDHVLIPQMMAAIARDKPRSRMSYALAWADTVASRMRAQQRQVYEAAGMAIVPVTPAMQAAMDACGHNTMTIDPTDRNSAISGAIAGSSADIGNPKFDPADGQAEIEAAS